MRAAEDIVSLAADRLAGTRAVDASGRLLVLHHATNKPFESFELSSDLGFHFGSRSQALARRRNMIQRGEAEYNDAWRTISVALAIRNPLIMPDDPGVWGPRWLTATLSWALDDLDRDRIAQLAQYFDDRVDDDITDVDREQLKTWMAVLQGALRRAGYDGIVYRNVFEATGRAIEWSWVAFDDAQIIHLGDLQEVSSLSSKKIETGAPMKLRGVSPMRHHQPRGTGYLMRDADVVAFRGVIDDWARETGLEWTRAYPLDYKKSFGEAQPSNDLAARVGEAAGYCIQVCSKRGEVELYPFSKQASSAELMRRFSCSASEGFFQHGLKDAPDSETITWRPGEPLSSFKGRLNTVGEQFIRCFDPELDLGPRP